MSLNTISTLNDDYIYIRSCGIVDLNLMFDAASSLCFFLWIPFSLVECML